MLLGTGAGLVSSFFSFFSSFSLKSITRSPSGSSSWSADSDCSVTDLALFEVVAIGVVAVAAAGVFELAAAAIGFAGLSASVATVRTSELVVMLCSGVLETKRIKFWFSVFDAIPKEGGFSRPCGTAR